MLHKLKAKLEELKNSRPSCADDKYYRDDDTGHDYQEYEADKAAHNLKIECLQLAITKVENASKIRHAMDLINT